MAQKRLDLSCSYRRRFFFTIFRVRPVSKRVSRSVLRLTFRQDASDLHVSAVCTERETSRDEGWEKCLEWNGLMRLELLRLLLVHMVQLALGIIPQLSVKWLGYMAQFRFEMEVSVT